MNDEQSGTWFNVIAFHLVQSLLYYKLQSPYQFYKRKANQIDTKPQH